MPYLTVREARECWEYNPDSGIMYWKISPAHGVKVGDVAGAAHYKGYVRVRFKGKSYKVHRLIWLIVHGELPQGQIDHINGVRNDNRLANLRVVSNRQNLQNKACNRSGHLVGTSYHKRRSSTPWQAQIYAGGKVRFLGYFATQQEAHNRYMQELNKEAPDETA